MKSVTESEVRRSRGFCDTLLPDSESNECTQQDVTVQPPGLDSVLSVYHNNKCFKKRAFDLTCAFLLLPFGAPLLIAIAIIVRWDGGPALFRHERVGWGGRTFACFKYRTMVVDAEARLARLLEEDPQARAEWLAGQKLKHDPQVTRIGRWLRRTSLDELPQLLNVLRGDMSLVGPWPIVRGELARYGADIAHYLRACPGITGLWQVSGRNDVSYHARVALDFTYITNMTSIMDVMILVRTVYTVIAKRGAY